jgi:hypothetical protein
MVRVSARGCSATMEFALSRRADVRLGLDGAGDGSVTGTALTGTPSSSRGRCAVAACVCGKM